MNVKERSEEVVKNFFEDHEKYGTEVAFLKHLDDNCVWVFNEQKNVIGLNDIMARIKELNRVFKRPYAHIVIKNMSIDEAKKNAVLVDYLYYTYNKETGDAFKDYYFSAFEVENDKITRRTDIYEAKQYRYYEALRINDLKFACEDTRPDQGYETEKGRGVQEHE